MSRFCGQKMEQQKKEVHSDGNFFRVTFKSNDIYDATGFESFYQFRKYEGKGCEILYMYLFALLFVFKCTIVVLLIIFILFIHVYVVFASFIYLYDQRAVHSATNHINFVLVYLNK